MAITCLGVAILAAIASAAGVFGRGGAEFITVTSPRGDTYDMAITGVYAYSAERVVAEGVGWDVVTLLLAVPLLLVAVPFVARGSYRGRLIAAGLLGYFLYAYLEYSVTWAFGPLFLLFVAACGLSLVGIAWIGWSLVADRDQNPIGEPFPRRPWAALNLAMSSLLTLMWLQRISLAMGGDTTMLLGETTMTVQALDLGLVVPLSVMGAVLVLQRSQLGYTFAAAFGVTFVMLSIAITGMLVSAAIEEGTPEIVPIAIFGVAAGTALALLIRMYRRQLTAPRIASDMRGAQVPAVSDV
jgi:hypothetical protein